MVFNPPFGQSNRLTMRSLIALVVLGFSSCSQEVSEPTPRRQNYQEPPEQVVKLAAEADARDGSLWSNEIDAGRHEAVIVDLWDRVRAAPDAYAVLRDFPFQAIHVGQLGPREELENGVFRTRLEPESDEKSLDRKKWSELLLFLQGRGFVLAQSEWHHASFVPAKDGRPASSEVVFEAHWIQPRAPIHMLVVEGTLRIVWKSEPPKSSVAKPEILSIHTESLALVEREGQLGFARVFHGKPPQQSTGEFEYAPVIVNDLDGDGLPEIVLGATNTVMWNRGGFRFESQRLLANQVTLRNSGTIADFDGDGLVDLLGVKPDGAAVLVSGDKTGRFRGEHRRPWDVLTRRASAMTCGDVDSDGDLDVWLSQYQPPYVQGQMPTPFYDANDGQPSYLFINDGRGNFTDGTEAAGLSAKRHRRTYSNSFVDLDEDGDLDLLVVSDFSGLDIHANDGEGNFVEATSDFVDEHHAFGMSHTFGDFDRDGKLDFYMAGMSSTTARRLDQLGLARADFPEYTKRRAPMTFGNRLYQRRGARYVQTSLNNHAARTGWTWGCAAADFDNDGDDDLYVANGHISGESATDYCTRYWCHDIYTGNSRANRDIAQLLSDKFRPDRLRGLGRGRISWNGYEKNRLLMNLGGRDFVDVGFLMGTGFEDDCRSVVAADLDGDGKQDLVVVATHWQPGKELTPKQQLYLLRNLLPARERASWLGVHLGQSEKGASPVGARVVIEGPFGERTRTYMTGDSFYAQHPATAHFGLPDGERVRRIRVRWTDGDETTLENPAPEKYHRLGVFRSRKS